MKIYVELHGIDMESWISSLDDMKKMTWKKNGQRFEDMSKGICLYFD